LRQEFDGDGVGVLRHEVALRHFQLVALERAAARDKLVARPRCEDEKIGFVPFAFDREPRLGSFDVHAQHAGPLHLAAGGLCAIQQEAVQHLSRIDHNGMLHFERRAMLLAADQLDGMN